MKIRRTTTIIIAAIVFLLTILLTPGSVIFNWQFIPTSFANQTDIIPNSDRQLLSIYQPIQDVAWEGQFITPKGITYFAASEVTDGYLLRTGAENDLATAQTMSDAKAQTEALFNIGIGYHVEGDYDKAIDTYKQCLDKAREISNRDLEVMTLGNLGLAYSRIANYADAIDYFNEYFGFTWHKAYYYNGTDPRLGEMALGNIGNAYYSEDLYAKAIEFHKKRLDLAKEIKDIKGEGKALGDIGIVYQALGEYDKAIDSQQQYLGIAREVKDSYGEIEALGNLGITYQSLGDYEKAIAAFQQGLAKAKITQNRRQQAKSLSNLGGSYYFSGDFAKAIQFYEEAWEVSWNHINDARILYAIRGNEGLAYFEKGDLAKAIQFYQEYLKLTYSYNNRRGEGVARNNLALAYLKSGNLAEAEKQLREAIKIWEDLRNRLGGNDIYKISLFETQTAIYSNLQQILIAQNRINEALEIGERGRARAFVELLQRRLSPDSKQNLTIAPITIEQIKQTAKNHNATIVEYSVIANTFKINNQIQTRESSLYVWVIKPSGEVSFRSVDLKPLWEQKKLSLDKIVVNSRAAIGARGRGLGAVERVEQPSRRRLLAQLYELLIKPIADLLPTDSASRVIFIPHRQLFLVPFIALQDEKGKFLIENYNILTAPSIQVLDLTFKSSTASNSRGAKGVGDILVMGNPTMPSIPPDIGEPPVQLPSLPGAEQEANAIAKLLNTKAITGNEATKANIVPKMQQSKIVHLATHGLLDDFTGQGIPGAIALAPDGKDNGLLTAEEILNLKLNADLIVLSACDTGRGRITGDGVVGLSRSLITAGVPSIIVSLWAVPDAPTASLMTEFYRNLQQNPDKAAALRNAMLTTMKQYPNPIDWAAFTLMGEP
ncbi:CHAT domain-containing protein [Limnofasciculus baicalensis]|uniref:CHAT domain-containing tetratricopeptide repeat protein n=1 Tax=Limnofasciculus baicalensis BBK-W-15 TaxID=2699891 RepID=A0AAE3GW24_9CYAN|nr:CHAT domain-containing tetratricopeptide repeat protein [Limnofasciculus baicalensis]MCP2729622.1 CHAT domain-containing tetratricopeptide repeat protein [Limnofasciculus baicalensis BBK-W-15]